MIHEYCIIQCCGAVAVPLVDVCAVIKERVDEGFIDLKVRGKVEWTLSPLVLRTYRSDMLQESIETVRLRSFGGVMQHRVTNDGFREHIGAMLE